MQPVGCTVDDHVCKESLELERRFHWQTSNLIKSCHATYNRIEMQDKKDNTPWGGGGTPHIKLMGMLVVLLRG